MLASSKHAPRLEFSMGFCKGNLSCLLALNDDTVERPTPTSTVPTKGSALWSGPARSCCMLTYLLLPFSLTWCLPLCLAIARIQLASLLLTKHPEQVANCRSFGFSYYYILTVDGALISLLLIQYTSPILP